MTSEFDAIGYVQRLESSGVSRAQAEVHAQALTELTNKLVSKDDLRRESGACEDRLTLRIELVKTELMAESKSIRSEIKPIHDEMIVHRWLLGILMAFNSANTAMLIKLLFN